MFLLKRLYVSWLANFQAKPNQAKLSQGKAWLGSAHEKHHPKQYIKNSDPNLYKPYNTFSLQMYKVIVKFWFQIYRFQDLVIGFWWSIAHSIRLIKASRMVVNSCKSEQYWRSYNIFLFGQIWIWVILVLFRVLAVIIISSEDFFFAESHTCTLCNKNRLIT